MAEESELGEEELKLLEASYRFVADAGTYDQFIDGWMERLERIDQRGAGRLDDFLINRHLGSLSAMMKKIALDDSDPKDPIEDVVSSVAGAALILSPSNLVVALNDLAFDKWNVRRGASTSMNWLDPTSLENLEQVRRSAMQRGNHLHSIVRTISDDGRIDLAEAFVVDEDVNPGLVAIRALDFGWTEHLSALLMESFDLTEAETEVCRLLLDVRGTDEIADIRSTSVHTIRTQLRTIFAKTQTANQVDLIRLLGLVSSHLARRDNLESGKWQDPLGYQKIFQDSYGRNIAYSWMGDPEGRPALLSHGMATGYLLHPDGVALLHERRIKLYCISRPSFGDSDPSPRKDASLGAADAIVALAQHLNIEEWVVVGLAVGAIPLFLASQNPASGIKGIVGSSSYIPFTPEESFDHFSPARRVANRFARTSPMLTELAVMVTYRMMRIKGPEHIWQTMYSACEADKKAASDPDCVALIRTAAALLTAQKHKALTNDMRMISAYWYDDFMKCEIPVQFLHGTADAAIPVEKLTSMIEDKPNMQLEMIAGAGELLYYYHSDKLVTALADMTDEVIGE
ncbi:MAG: alpha/beta fold hydrolase [Parasphingorhabdus sp.]